jgi:hypothetical protein
LLGANHGGIDVAAALGFYKAELTEHLSRAFQKQLCTLDIDNETAAG